MPGGDKNIKPSDNPSPFTKENQPDNPGRKPKVFSELANEYKARGIERASPEAVKEAFEYLFALSDKEVLDISNGLKPDYPILIVICAKQMQDKRQMGRVLETMLDRAHGKAKQQVDVTSGGETINAGSTLSKEQEKTILEALKNGG